MLDRLARQLEHELASDDDEVDAWYRRLGKSEGEIVSYRMTRYAMRLELMQRTPPPPTRASE